MQVLPVLAAAAPTVSTAARWSRVCLTGLWSRGPSCVSASSPWGSLAAPPWPFAHHNLPLLSRRDAWYGFSCAMKACSRRKSHEMKTYNASAAHQGINDTYTHAKHTHRPHDRTCMRLCLAGCGDDDQEAFQRPPVGGGTVTENPARYTLSLKLKFTLPEELVL